MIRRTFFGALAAMFGLPWIKSKSILPAAQVENDIYQVTIPAMTPGMEYKIVTYYGDYFLVHESRVKTRNVICGNQITITLDGQIIT